ncbi:hypothetical protein DFP73DRAFT_559632 [Morchella snyderi]|nr:hypothetical protein DFP73DRAFT_559632 [Morchella snyderi]
MVVQFCLAVCLVMSLISSRSWRFVSLYDRPFRKRKRVIINHATTFPPKPQLSERLSLPCSVIPSDIPCTHTPHVTCHSPSRGVIIAPPF